MAEKTLVVVESPSKAKTINKYLGTKYIVEASVGHIKDLEKHKLGVDVENEFQPKYVTVRGKAPLIKSLKKIASGAKEVLIATDPDREGEAIAWHIAEELGKDNKNIKRVLFNEITKSGIKKGLQEPREIDNKLFMSQQARRVMDRLIGYQVSPFLSRAMLSKTSQSLSAGRVQSVALRLICEREEEIRNFTPINYFSINADFLDEKKYCLQTRLVAFDGKNLKNPEGSATSTIESEQKEIDNYLSNLHYIRDEAQAKSLIERIKKETFSVKDINKKKVKRSPQAPFTTSSLQQEASKRLGFSNKKTMMIAQKLYEGVNLGPDGAVGLITYMRTDSVRISPEAEVAAREYVERTYGAEYLPPSPPKYSSKSSNVQDAHEAVRPSMMDFAPVKVKEYLDRDEYRLYELIFNRFLASQMSPAQLDQTTINIQGGDFVFRATGSIIAFKGFLAVYDDIKEENGDSSAEPESGILPAYLKEEMPMNLSKIDKQSSSTKPKPRYNEASLVKELDEKGIGRPSTYASIVTTLIDRNYVSLEKKSFEPTELGMDVNQVLVKNFPELFAVKFTADMENQLDTIAEGDNEYAGTMKNFYGPFKHALDEAEKSGNIEEILCEVCGAPMVIKVSRRGRFLGCSKYPECTSTKPLPKGANEKKEEPVLAEGVTCDICGKEMYIRTSKFGKFYGCADYPNCKGIKQITIDVKCPKCKEGLLSEKWSPKTRKAFWGCSRYPECDYITNYQPVVKKCPACGHDYLEIRFKKVDGDWQKYLSCPECKEKFEMAE
jgi:DNA topoisomerase-1